MSSENLGGSVFDEDEMMLYPNSELSEDCNQSRKGQ
jgi:hypothetical protein